MRGHHRLSFLVLLVLVEAFHGEALPGEREQAAAGFTEDGARGLMQHLNDVYWQSATAYRKVADDTISPEIWMREKLRPYFEAMSQYDWQHFNDMLLRRQFEVILRGRKYPPLENKFKRATHTLKSMSREKWACQRQKPDNCDLGFVPQIKSIFTNSDDLDELKFYWLEWRNKMPGSIKDALHYYIQYYRNMSTPDLPASAIWYEQYQIPDFIVILEKLMETIKPFYREMHAHIRHVLRVQYGEHVIPDTGLIPHHLFEQVAYQAWRKNSVLINPFPERRLPNLQAELDGAGLTAFDLVNISAQFFGSLGFEHLTSDFMREHFIEMEPGIAGHDCKSRIFDFGKVELHYCPKVYFRKLLQTHGDMARFHYALARSNLRVGLNAEACPGFGNVLGEATILSVSTPKHLQQKLGLLSEYDYDNQLNLNRLYRMAVHTLLTLPVYFVHERLWVDMIDGKVPPAEYNCHYWNLMQEYMGVDAPAQSNADAYDMPYKFYEGIVDQFRSTKKLVGEFLGYELYREFCREAGDGGDVLSNCDFANNRQAGALLRDIMNAGSSMHWRDVILPLWRRNFTKLTASAFLQYFDPLHNWISKANRERNLSAGWTVSDRCQTINEKKAK